MQIRIKHDFEDTTVEVFNPATEAVVKSVTVPSGSEVTLTCVPAHEPQDIEVSEVCESESPPAEEATREEDAGGMADGAEPDPA